MNPKPHLKHTKTKSFSDPSIIFSKSRSTRFPISLSSVIQYVRATPAHGPKHSWYIAIELLQNFSMHKIHNPRSNNILQCVAEALAAISRAFLFERASCSFHRHISMQCVCENESMQCTNSASGMFPQTEGPSRRRFSRARTPVRKRATCALRFNARILCPRLRSQRLPFHSFFPSALFRSSHSLDITVRGRAKGCPEADVFCHYFTSDGPAHEVAVATWARVKNASNSWLIGQKEEGFVEIYPSERSFREFIRNLLDFEFPRYENVFSLMNEKAPCCIRYFFPACMFSGYFSIPGSKSGF